MRTTDNRSVRSNFSGCDDFNDCLPHSASPMIQSNWMLSSVRQYLVAFALLLVTAPAFGADTLDKNIALLQHGEDFRVRTQAALALGASRAERAVAPLCRALADENRTVRIASATAISRLRLGGQSCLKSRLPIEKDALVLSSIEKALDRLGGAGAEPAIGPDTSIFVAISKISGPERLDSPVRGAFVKAARGRGEVAFAPSDQTSAEATRVLSQHPGAKGFKLSPKLSKPSYADGMLQVKMSVAIMSYPGNSLLASFSKSVGMQGVNAPDTESENELVLLVAEESMKQFLALAPSLDP